MVVSTNKTIAFSNNTLIGVASSSSPTFTGNVTLPNTTSIGDVNSTEISYLDGVSSALQTQLNGKANTASPTFTGTVLVPTLNLTNALSVQYGGIGTTSLTANAVILGNGTSAVQTIAPGTSGNILTSNGTTWASSAPTPSFTTGKAIAMAIVFGG